MRLAHVELIGGAAGNMLLGAFLDAGLDPDRLENSLRTIVADGWTLERKTVVKRGVSATHADFSIEREADGERHLADVLRLLNGSALTAQQKARAQGAYRRLAQAEANVHGTSVEGIHFHECGALDAILDVAATCVALDLLQIERLTCSPVPIGRGMIRMHHGVYPNPPPATAELLLGMPTYDAGFDGELVTPTAAALLASLCSEFGSRPAMIAESIGYGAGTMELPIPNVTRITIGAEIEARGSERNGEISVIEANIDDMSPQFYELAIERIFAAGAKDVWLTPIVMKKNRPAITLSAIADTENEAAVARAMLRETSTIGVRARVEGKYVMERSHGTLETPFGSVRTKRSRFDGETGRETIEYDDLVRVARQTGRPISEIATVCQQALGDRLVSS